MSRYDFDVVVVGAGIGGLVCANYLTKFGMKVLVVEKNNKPGGYCTSFQRRGFLFDAVIHSIQNCNEGNVLYKIFHELGVSESIKIFRCNPTDSIVTANNKIHVMNDVKETVENFRKAYPDQKDGIIKFFNLFMENNFLYLFSKYKNAVFSDVLNHYFSCQELKSIFALFLGNIGSLPSNTCAVTAFALLRQFILTGGYYPSGGIQSIPDALSERLKLNNGILMLSKKVEEIIIKDKCVCGVRLNDGQTIHSKIVVSNADLTFTIKKLLTTSSQYQTIIDRLDKAQPSYSIYIVYMVLKKRLNAFLNLGPGVWYVPLVDRMQNMYRKGSSNLIINPGIFCSIASKLDSSIVPEGYDQVRIMINTKYKNQVFWKENAKRLSSGLIDLATDVIPCLRDCIVCEGRATSVTMENYTFNRGGAVCGWLNSPEQVNDPISRYLPDINGLFFVGHWITERYGNGGIAMVADSGKKTAKLIIKKNE